VTRKRATDDLDEALAEGFDAFLVDPERHRAAWDRANLEFKRAQDGQARVAKRKPASQWTHVKAVPNEPLIVFIALWGPVTDLLTKPLGQTQIDKIMAWLQTPATGKIMAPRLRRASWDEDALARAIRRVKKNPRLIRLVAELRTAK
jgi:hypothetical protein